MVKGVRDIYINMLSKKDYPINYRDKIELSQTMIVMMEIIRWGDGFMKVSVENRS
jgi:hypothetical protein